MKKKSILKLKLKKASVSNLNENSVKGGFGDSFYICESVNNFCQTINVTRCYGNLNCGLFDPNTVDC